MNNDEYETIMDQIGAPHLTAMQAAVAQQLQQATSKQVADMQWGARQKAAAMNAYPTGIASNTYGGQLGNQLMSSNTATTSTNIRTPESFDPNKSEAYMIPLSKLILLWQTKFGDTWVNRRSLEKDDFWEFGTPRLRTASVFEVAEHDWVRLKEEHLGNS